MLTFRVEACRAPQVPIQAGLPCPRVAERGAGAIFSAQAPDTKSAGAGHEIARLGAGGGSMSRNKRVGPPPRRAAANDEGMTRAGLLHGG